MVKLGFMSFAHMHAFSYAEAAKLLPDVELVAIFDDNVARGQEMAERFGMVFEGDLDRFFQLDIDAVVICSENNQHAWMTMEAAKYGKHVLCEKPLATTVVDAEAMIAACEKAGVILQTAFPVRFTRSIQKLKGIVDAGNLGEIVAMRSTNRGQYPGGWFVDLEQSAGGAVLDHTVHMVDIMRWLLGSEVVNVTSQVDNFYYGDSAESIDDAGVMTLEFANGVIASHDASWSRYKEYPVWGDVQLEVIGTAGTAQVSNILDNIFEFGPVTDGRPRTYHFNGFGNNTDFDLIKDFTDTVSRGGEPSITGYDGLKAMEVGLAAYESARQGQSVEL
ncbi:Gfo/Idh/MocA family protein [Fundicoccus sp. Sow4_H7]|uniref:Gfo/Idh/MocA family protein n=1 Tax=Fundicoccus sp. Sow4_H7 TaxID=3438784 RepID=UPI003F8E41CF